MSNDQPKLRRRVPSNAADELLVRNRHTCCVCRVPGRSVQIHHINEDPSDNDEVNLAVVCLECHSKATSTGGLGRRLSAGAVRKYKRYWEHLCQHEPWRSLPELTGRDIRQPWFAAITVASDVCLWTPRQRHADLDVAYHFHQIPKRAYDELDVASDTHALDPILDIVIVNAGDRPAVLTGVGFEPLMCWTDLKGIPDSGRVLLQDTFELCVQGFEIDRQQVLELSEPIFMEREAPYRFRLWLRRFTEEASGNETTIRVFAKFAEQTSFSDRIYLGLY